ncbi:MAG: S8/S53 family peptidase [Kineosporiaceae bacterium]
MSENEPDLEVIADEDYEYPTPALDEDQDRSERAGVARQVGAIRGAVQASPPMLDLIRERRGLRPDHTVPVPTRPQRPGAALCADGELVIAAPRGEGPVSLSEQFLPVDAPTVNGADVSESDPFGHRLQIQRFAATRPEERTTRTWQLAASAALETQLRADSRTHRVAPNHVMVLQPSVMKGDGSPEPTSRRLRYPVDLAEHLAGREPATVAIVDTGLAEEVRRDAWLTGLTRSADNRDALNVLPPLDRIDLGAGHGTFVSGVIQQVCPTAQIRVYRALDTDGMGSETQVAAMMVQAVLDGADIVSLSLGTQTDDDRPPLAFRVALDEVFAINPDALVLAAAGNNGDDRPVWPAAFPSVVAVGAVTADLAPAEWSSHGFWVDCSCVGEGVVSTFVPGREIDEVGGTEFGDDAWAMWTGTSFAVAQIAGALARLVQGNRHLGWTPRHALSRLLGSRPWLLDYGRVVRLLPGTPRP